jgi:predicted nucleic acid-binding protein
LITFFDASALVKRYVDESGTPAIRALFRTRRLRPAVSRLTAVEVPAALARRARRGDLSERAARACAKHLTADLAEMHVVEPRGALIEQAADLVWRHDLRAYDALQLASALYLFREVGSATRFVCADRALTVVAVREGLRALAVGTSA